MKKIILISIILVFFSSCITKDDSRAISCTFQVSLLDEEVTDVIYSNTTNYFYCNWGWANEWSENGYFVSGVFNAYNYQDSSPGYADGYYRYDLKMLTDIFR